MCLPPVLLFSSLGVEQAASNPGELVFGNCRPVNDVGHLKHSTPDGSVLRDMATWFESTISLAHAGTLIPNNIDRWIHLSCTLLPLWLMDCTRQMACWVKGQQRFCLGTKKRWSVQLGHKPLTLASIALSTNQAWLHHDTGPGYTHGPLLNTEDK